MSLQKALDSIFSIFGQRRQPGEPRNPDQKEFTFFRYVRPLDLNNPNIDPTDDEAPYFPGPHGGVTIYFRWKPEISVADFSFSICHEGEPFVRAQGRGLAMEKAMQGELYRLTGISKKVSLAGNVYLGLVDHFGRTEQLKDLLRDRFNTDPDSVVIPKLEKLPASQFSPDELKAADRRLLTLYHTLQSYYAMHTKHYFDLFDLHSD